MSREAMEKRDAAAGYAAQSEQDVSAGYKRTEVGVIPNDWECKALREGIKLFSGHHVLAQYCNMHGNGIPYLTGPSDFVNGKVNQTKFTNRPVTRCKTGDILVTVKGSGSGTLFEADASYCISRQLMAIRTEEWDSKFIFYTLLQNASQIKAASAGLIPGLSRSDILNQKIPVPRSIGEQRAIATALSDVDALITALEGIIAKKRAIKTAAMQQLLTGKTRLPGFSSEWETKRLGDVADVVSGGTPKSSIPEYWDGGINWCTPTDVTKTRGKYITTTDRTISKKGLTASSANLLPVGAILLCTRATIGEMKIAKVPIATNQGFKSLICRDSINNEFLYYKLQMEKLRLIEKASGSTFLEISKKDVVNLGLSIPKREEQTAIAQLLSDMDAEIAALEARRDKTRAIKQGMMQELLTGRTRLVEPETIEAA